MSLILIVYMSGFFGYEARSIINYHDETKYHRVATKGEVLAIDTITNLVWPLKAGYQIKEITNDK